MTATNETTTELLEFLKTSEYSLALEMLETGDSRYLRDLKVNITNVMDADHLTAKESSLIALAIATNAGNKVLMESFRKMALENDANEAEIAEAVACDSLLASNNVFYRFRHFIGKETYNKLPGKIKMNIMLRPVSGKEFFELMSLAVSAVNGCEMCVQAHEKSLIDLGTSEERIWDAIRLSSVITSLTKVVS